MEIVTKYALGRGALLVDYALSQKWERQLDLSVSELIGVVAAYLARGGKPSEIEQDLGDYLSPQIGRRCANVYSVFEDIGDRGLWS